jgi:RhoGEF domain
LLEGHGEALEQIKRDTGFLRRQYPDTQVPNSILEPLRTAETIFGDSSSTVDGPEFAFDDLIVNSKAYRRVLALAQAQVAQKPGPEPTDQAHSVENDWENRIVSQEIQPADSIYHAVDEERSTQKEDGITIRGAVVLPSTSAPPRALIIGRNTPYIQSVPSSKALPISTSSPKIWVAPGLFRTLDSQWPTGSIEWLDTFNLGSWDLSETPQKTIEHQNVLWELFTTEGLFIRTLNTALQLHKESLATASRDVLPDPAAFAEQLFDGFEEIRRANTDNLYYSLLEHWEKHGAWASFEPEAFSEFVHIASPMYVALARRLPWKLTVVRHEAAVNKSFGKLLDTLSRKKWSCRLSLDHYLNAPMRRVQQYCQLFAAAQRSSPNAAVQSEISRLLLAFDNLNYECNAAFGEAARKLPLEMVAYDLDPGDARSLNLQSQPCNVFRRELLPCLLPKAPRGEGEEVSTKWRYYYVIRLDNDLVFARPPSFKLISGADGWGPVNVKHSTLRIVLVR